MTPKIVIVSLSEVRKGNGCMLAQRFTGDCDTCDRVSRCKNEQAVTGRAKAYERRRQRAYEILANSLQQIAGLAALDPWNMNGDFLHPLDINPKESPYVW